MRSAATTHGRSRAIGLATIAMAVSFGACHDIARSVDPQPSDAHPDVIVSPIVVDSTFNFFSADITMEITGVQTIEQPTVVRTVSYHVSRTLGSDSVWTTTTTFSGSEPFGTPVTGGASTVDIARVVTTSDGLAGDVYDRQNNLMAPPPPVSFDTLIEGRSQFHSPSQGTLPTWPDRFGGTSAQALVRTVGARGVAAARGATLQPALRPEVVRHDTVAANADPRAWIRQFVVMPSERHALLASVSRRFGAPVGRVGGMTRYTKTVKSLLYEALVDPASGVTVEENVAENGRLRVHTVHRFMQMPNGALVRVRDRSEIAGTQESAPRAIIETTISNLHVETRGGAQ